MSITLQKPNQDNEVRTCPITAQIYKGLALTASSLGLGWALGNLWCGSTGQSSGESPTGIQQKYPIVQGGISSVNSVDATAAIFQQIVSPPSDAKSVSQQVAFLTNSLNCGLGLALSGAASIVAQNPLPAAIGALSCMPTVVAASATCEATATSNSQIKLSEFALEAQMFLQNFLSTCEYYENMDLRVLKAYKIQCEMVVVQLEIVTVEDFKSFIEDGLEYASVYNSKKIVCVSPSPPTPTPPPASPAVPSIAFGAEKWKKYFGDVETEPPLPQNIEEILNGPCPIWPNQKVKDTHILALIPETINGAPFNLCSLSKLVQVPKWGARSIHCESINCKEFKPEWFGYEYYHGIRPAPASHWILISRQTLSHSTHKTYEQQVQYVADLSQMSKVPYEIPHLLDVATSELVDYISTGNVKSDGKWIRVQEQSLAGYSLTAGTKDLRRIFFSLVRRDDSVTRYGHKEIACLVNYEGGDRADWHIGTSAARKLI